MYHKNSELQENFFGICSFCVLKKRTGPIRSCSDMFCFL
ncbi:hypothetical protein CU007_0277 [Enterococcus faecium]|nr:hypothetical protein [Enterococcus faecium]